MHASNDLPRLEATLRDAFAALEGRGWGRGDIRHALVKLVDRRQVALFDALVVLPGEGAGLEAWARHNGLALDRVATMARTLHALLTRLPRLAPDHAASSPAGNIDVAVLERVRALLSKAESTTFEAEADALSAKAQEMMAKHSIDRALLEGRAVSGATVATRRFLIEDPYARARFTLLSEVARACGCDAVLLEPLGIANVFGFGDDLTAVDLLYTSLLVQASTAVAAARPPGRRAASQLAAFRRAFLVAFAQRVGLRLTAVRSDAVHEAQIAHGDSILPVLANRRSLVEAHMVQAAPNSRRMSQRLSDAGGYQAGQSAGDRATFSHQATLAGGQRALGE
ncbi:MAG: DUF2786 domain-containing protein [Acidimicrobiales bacterium]